MRTIIARSAGLFALWIVLIQSVHLADLVVGAFTVTVATWLSLRLLPPAAGRVRLGVLAARLPRFAWQSVRAGFDVARRAFSPTRLSSVAVNCSAVRSCAALALPPEAGASPSVDSA